MALCDHRVLQQRTETPQQILQLVAALLGHVKGEGHERVQFALDAAQLCVLGTLRLFQAPAPIQQLAQRQRFLVDAIGVKFCAMLLPPSSLVLAPRAALDPRLRAAPFAGPLVPLLIHIERGS